MKLLLLTRHVQSGEDAISTWAFEMAKRLATRCEHFSTCHVGAGEPELARSELGHERRSREPGAPRATSISAWELAASRGRRFDVVLGSEWLSASFGLAWRGRSGERRLFSVVHGPELAWRRPQSALGRVYRTTAELALGRFDAVFAASSPAHALLDGVKLRRSEFIGRACDPARFRPAPRGRLARELGVLDRRVLLSVGRLVPERRVDKVLFALSALGVRYPDLCYVVAGAGPERERLELLAERLRIAHRVRFLGRVGAAALPEVYNLGDVFVHLCGAGPALADGDGVALLQALASARPVVVSAGEAAAEGVDDQTGIIVPEDDSNALGDAVCALLDDPQLRSSIGLRARARVLSGASWELVADRLVRAMTRGLRSSRSDRAGEPRRREDTRGAALVER